jgi:plastocyanin
MSTPRTQSPRSGRGAQQQATGARGRGSHRALRGLAAAGLLALLAGGAARAEEPVTVELTIRDHRFIPAELRVPAGKVVVVRIRNEDPTAEEFESKPLKVEKVIAGGKTATVRIRPLEKGRYPFVGEFHEATASGSLIAE